MCFLLHVSLDMCGSAFELFPESVHETILYEYILYMCHIIVDGYMHIENYVYRLVSTLPCYRHIIASERESSGHPKKLKTICTNENNLVSHLEWILFWTSLTDIWRSKVVFSISPYSHLIIVLSSVQPLPLSVVCVCVWCVRERVHSCILNKNRIRTYTEFKLKKKLSCNA